MPKLGYVVRIIVHDDGDTELAKLPSIPEAERCDFIFMTQAQVENGDFKEHLMDYGISEDKIDRAIISISRTPFYEPIEMRYV